MNGGCFHCGARASCRHRVVDEPIRANRITHRAPATDLRPFNPGKKQRLPQGYNFSGKKKQMLEQMLLNWNKRPA